MLRSARIPHLPATVLGSNPHLFRPGTTSSVLPGLPLRVAAVTTAWAEPLSNRSLEAPHGQCST
jgi:hypothetical protein